MGGSWFQAAEIPGAWGHIPLRWWDEPVRVWITHGHPEGKGMRWDKVDLRNLDLLQAGIVLFF